ncbi:MAG: PTS sugar transporter subunit IIA [Elusimicrobiota bacterium]|jgi:PTS system nitrogen regulatory IIA component
MQLIVKDAARLLSVSEKTIYRWIEEGILPAYRVNEQYRFNRAELLEWATAHKVRVSPDIYKEVGGDAADLPSLESALAAGGVHGAVSAPDKTAALRSAVQRIRLPEDADRGYLLDVMLAREANASSGVGEGVAMPHVRNPVVLNLDQPMVALCYLEPPVDFGADDKQPVHTVFTILSASIRGHLHMLSRLAYAMHDPEFKALLARHAGEAEVVACARRIESGLKGGPA